MKYSILQFVFLIFTSSFCMQATESRWALNNEGGITWNVDDNLPHHDHIEMSGKKVSVVFRYGVEADGSFKMNKGLVFPLLRTIPNNTHASLMRKSNWNPLNLLEVNGNSLLNEKVKNVSIKGVLEVESEFPVQKGILQVTRSYFPAIDQPAVLNLITLTNKSEKPVRIEVPRTEIILNTDPAQGVEGSYRIEMRLDKEGVYYLQPNESLQLTASTAAYNEKQKSLVLNGSDELGKRKSLVSGWMDHLVLKTPDETINRMFAFAKIRACESIYDTKGGPMHGPGGESYYAAIWANDQAEYINPFFPFVGYEYGNKSALNSYHHFARFINKDWKPIPSSIIAEGTDVWDGAGDRGDAAMIAYGAARYALARGDKEEATELWPLIEWCLEFCKRKINDGGVVASDSDELEGRFPAGDANLCTSSLYYDALISAACLNKELGGSNAKSSAYKKEAATLRKNIEKYFGSNVEGFNTYAYYAGNNILRSWICIPLTVNITERAAETLNALFSPRLWTDNGLLTQAGSETFWDRSTLYALRGAYTAGATEKATRFMQQYSKTRLLGEHVPYAIEAWPEGGQRHLSAESALYGRIITEGMFGIRPTGFATFEMTPRLPEAWDRIALERIEAFDSSFDVSITRTKPNTLQVLVTEKGKTIVKKNIREGETLTCNLR